MATSYSTYMWQRRPQTIPPCEVATARPAGCSTFRFRQRRRLALQIMSCTGVVLIALTAACSGSGSPGAALGSDGTQHTAGSVACVGASSSGAPLNGVNSSRAPLDVAALDAGVDDVLQVFGSKDAIRAVLISVDGRTVVERYPGATVDGTRNIYSVTKSVMSTLIGIAIAEHRLTGLDQTLGQMLPDDASMMRPEVAAITLRQLLTMTAGLPDSSSAGSSFASTPDWITAILTQGNDQQPGRFFAYSDAGAHLLSAILEKATGQSTFDYARRKLFGPLGISTEPAISLVDSPDAVATYNSTPGFIWPTDPQGHNTGYAGIKLSPGDLLKLGQLYLNHGQWNGAQLVPADWIDQATCTQIKTSEFMVGGGYGYMWWTMDVAGDPAFAANGYGGQLVLVIPARGLVVAVSSDATVDGPHHLIDNQQVITLMASQVVPKVPQS